MACCTSGATKAWTFSGWALWPRGRVGMQRATQPRIDQYRLVTQAFHKALNGIYQNKRFQLFLIIRSMNNLPRVVMYYSTSLFAVIYCSMVNRSMVLFALARG